jgi:hypothetical protein
MGGLHIEIASFHRLGHWVEGSPLIQCLIQADLATPDASDYLIGCSYVKQTCNAHFITAATLYVTMQRQYAS